MTTNPVAEGLTIELPGLFGGTPAKSNPRRSAPPAAELILYGGGDSKSVALRAYETDLAAIGYTGDVAPGSIAVQRKGAPRGRWRVYTFPKGPVEYATVQRDGATVWDSRSAGPTEDTTAAGILAQEATQGVTSEPGEPPAAAVTDETTAEDAEPAADVEMAPVSGVVLVDMDAAEAREITDQIRSRLEQTWELIKRAYLQRAWLALGHASWDDYCAAEFGTNRLRIPRDERALSSCLKNVVVQLVLGLWRWNSF